MNNLSRILESLYCESIFYEASGLLWNTEIVME